MSSNPIDRCKAIFEEAKEAFRNAAFREPAPEVGEAEARAQHQSLTEDEIPLIDRFSEHNSIMYSLSIEERKILNVDVDLTEANNERQVLDGIRQFKESADVVVFVINEFIRRQLPAIASQMRDDVEGLLDELDREAETPPPVLATTYELTREALRNAAFRQPTPEVKWCEARAQLRSMSEDALVEAFDIWLKGMYNDAYYIILRPSSYNIWGSYTAANSEEVVLEGISQFTESGDIVVFLIHEAIAREQNGDPERSSERRFSVSDWRRQFEDVLDKTRPCGRPCFHRGFELEDGRLGFPCDKEHQTSEENHES